MNGKSCHAAGFAKVVQMATQRLLIAMAILSVAGGVVCRSQGVAGGTLSVVAGVGAIPEGGVKNQPYFLTKKTTTVQKLADGTTITRSGGSTEARDSAGRTAVTTRFELASTATPDFAQTMVFDPVARTRLIWTSQSKQANLVQIMQIPQARPVAPVRSPATPASVVQTRRPQTGRPEIHREDLGAKMIAGVYALGSRMTITYPIGSMGNDRPMTTVNETWRAPDLNIVVLETNEDPRSGVRTSEVTELNRAEPDPKLFQVPAGYTVKEQKQENLNQ
jgi:hypothetical protein